MLLFDLDHAFIFLFAFTTYIFLSPNWRWLFLLTLSAGLLYTFDFKTLLATLAIVGWTYLMAMVVAQWKNKAVFTVAIGAIVATLVAKNLDLYSFRTLGLSFYAFQMIGYLTDVFAGRKSPERNIGKFFVFGLLIFNKIAGPIERSNLLDQFPRIELPSPTKLYQYLLLIGLGYFQKGVLADNLYAYVQPVFDHPTEFTGAPALMAVLLNKYQIFCDFSGSSLLALGTAGLFGLELQINFDRPFAATSLREFWSRWHISLQRWIRDYVFYPLIATPLSNFGVFPLLAISFLVFALWHDFRWTFAAYGLFQALWIQVDPERWLPSNTARRIGLYIFAISLPGVLFRAQTFSQAWTLWSSIGIDLSHWKQFTGLGQTRLETILGLILIYEFIAPKLPHMTFAGTNGVEGWIKRFVLILIFALILILFFYRQMNPDFVYSNF